MIRPQTLIEQTGIKLKKNKFKGKLDCKQLTKVLPILKDMERVHF